MELYIQPSPGDWKKTILSITHTSTALYVKGKFKECINILEIPIIVSRKFQQSLK